MKEALLNMKVSNWNHKVIAHLDTSDIGIEQLNGCDFGIIGAFKENDFATVYAVDKRLKYKPLCFDDGVLVFKVVTDGALKYENYFGLVNLIKEMAKYAQEEAKHE